MRNRKIGEVTSDVSGAGVSIENGAFRRRVSQGGSPRRFNDQVRPLTPLTPTYAHLRPLTTFPVWRATPPFADRRCRRGGGGGGVGGGWLSSFSHNYGGGGADVNAFARGQRR